MPFLNVIKGLFLKGSGPNAPSSVAATANSIGAVSTAPGFLSGNYILFSGSGLARIPIISGDPTFQQLTLTINASAAAAGGASFFVEVTNDPSSQWNYPAYIYRQGEGGGSTLNGYLVPTSAIAYATARAVTYIIGIAGFSYVRVRLTANTLTGTVLNNWVVTTTAAITPAATTNGIVSVDANTAVGIIDPVSSPAILGVGSFVVSATPTTSAWNAVRTPNVFRGAQFDGTGANVIWTPALTKKVRLMRYFIEVGEDATITSGPLPINLAFSQQLGTATGAKLTFNNAFGYTHRMVLPAAVLATSFDGYVSGWIDLGNGVLLDTAGRALTMGIQVPQGTGAITSPAWAISSNQWESATVGFKTNGTYGNARLIQQNNGVASSSSVALSAVQSITGNSIFVFFRTTNPAGGAPTVTVTDTAGNTYTTGTLVTNASDGANGSSLGMAYAVNATGNAANVVTVTTTVNLSTQIEAIYIEYAGVNSGGGIDAAQVGATGNSTAPASGNYTPATAGDLVFTFMATAASLASQPTKPTAFELRGSLFNATQGALAVADNFGNGTLITAKGQINVLCCGTEE